MANQNAQIIALTKASRSAFVTDTASVTDPIMCLISTATPEIGVKIAGVYSYFTITTAEFAALQAQIDANTASIAALNSLISGSYGAITRGQLSVPDAADAAVTSVPFSELTGEKNPLTAVKCNMIGTGVLLTFYASPAMLELLSKNDAAIGDPVFYAVNVPGDADALRLYDTEAHAESAGSTGWIAEFDVIADATPGTWAIKEISGGSLTGRTLGWMYAPLGVNYTQHSSVRSATLTSRDYSFTAAELQPGFEAEIPFRFKFQGDTPSSVAPRVEIWVETLGGTVTLNNSASVQTVDSANELGIISGRVLLTVPARYLVDDEDTIRIRTAVSFDDVTGFDSTNNEQFRSLPGVTETEVLASDLGLGYRFIELSGAGVDNVTTFEFVSSSMNVRYPVVIP